MEITTIFLDLDGTVYPADNGVWQAISKRIDLYLKDNIKILPEEIPAVREHYYNTYGTTLGGLLVHHEVDPVDYNQFVHDIPVAEYLSPDPQLQKLFSALPQKLWILTNSEVNHSQRILSALGIWEHFEGVMDARIMDYRYKPDPYVFEKALEIAGGLSPSESLFVDDIPKNLTPAAEMGFTTVLIGGQASANSAHYHIPRIHDLLRAIPGLISPAPTAAP